MTIAEKKTLKKLLAETAIERIKLNTRKSESSVAGGRFKASLSDDYKTYKKKFGSGSSANLRLTGALLKSLVSSTKGLDVDEVQIGIYKEEQAAKADGHCNYSGKSKLPERRFIPDEDHNFKKPIQDELKEIARGFIDDVARDKESASNYLKSIAASIVRNKSGS